MIQRKFKIIVLILFTFSMYVRAGEIHDSAKKENISKIRLLLEQDSTLVDAVDENRNTALYYAAENNSLEIAKLLISKGADIHAKNKWQSTPLHDACFNGSKNVAELLIEKGADINCKNKGGYTPLHDAATQNQIEIVDLLISHGIDLNSKNNYGRTPLHYAAVKGKLETLKFLISKGAKINTITKRFSYTPLIEAASHGRYEIVKILIENGATNLDHLTDYGASTLHRACTFGHANIVGLLIKNGADMNIRNNENKTPLISAAVSNKKECIDTLMIYGADSEIKEIHYKRTALHIASSLGYSDAVNALILGGAKINAKDKYKRTPLYYAKRFEHKKVDSILSKNGAKAYNVEKKYIKWENKLGAQEAIVWYLKFSSWAVQTKNHFVIFDYSDGYNKADEPALTNGYIVSENITNKNVYVFTSNNKDYDPLILDWSKTIANIRYIFGFQPEKSQKHKEGYQGLEYLYIKPHEYKTCDDIEITTIKSINSGVGFLIKVESLTIFHAGYHVNKSDKSFEEYKKEIDNITKYSPGIDIAFLPVTYRYLDNESVKKGFIYAANKLNAKMVFPMRSYKSLEHRYVEFADYAQKNGYKGQFACAEIRGEYFYYKNGEIIDSK